MQFSSNKITRRGLVQGGAALAATSALHKHQTTKAQTPVPGDDIVREVGVQQMRAAYEAREYSIAEFTDASLQRIEAMDRQGALLHAMIELNPDALAIAEQLDEELRAGKSRGPMHGVPVVVKDVFATADSMQTRAGSRSMNGTIASRDAFIVERMREAGMIILGKSNLTEWSGFRPVLYGWSPLGGLSVNPNVTTQTTWGSSSGSAAAVAASYAPVSVGVETDGSVICPASACGVVGIKPTVGLASRSGAIGNGYTMDSPGVMGRSVADAAALLSVIAGLDSEDVAFGEHADLFPAGREYATLVHPTGVRDYTRAIVDGGLEGVRIGVVRAYWGSDSEANRHAENALLAMQDAGAELVEDIYPEGFYEVEGTYAGGETMGIEFPALFDRFLRNYAPDSPVHSLEDVAQWYNENPDESQWAWEYDALSSSLWADEEWSEAHLAWIEELTVSARQNCLDPVMDDYDLDALVAPTCALPTRWDNVSHFWASSKLAASAGYPSVTVPIGYTENVPAGLHFFGRAFSERKLIRYAAELERTLQARVAPEFLESTNYDDIYAPIPW